MQLSSYKSSAARHDMLFTLLITLFLTFCVETEVRAGTLVVPNVLATNDADSAINVPAGPVAYHYMIMFDASQFSALSGPSFLTQFTFRPDLNSDMTGPRTIAARIYASTTKLTIAGMSQIFSQNIGTNNTLVFDGILSQVTQNLPGPGNTRQFDMPTPFTTPFLYDPAQGNLVLDFRVSNDDGQPISFDAVTDDPTIRCLISVGSPNNTAGDFAVPQATQFTFEVPFKLSIRPSQVEVCWNSVSNQTYQVQRPLGRHPERLDIFSELLSKHRLGKLFYRYRRG